MFSMSSLSLLISFFWLYMTNCSELITSINYILDRIAIVDLNSLRLQVKDDFIEGNMGINQDLG